MPASQFISLSPDDTALIAQRMERLRAWYGAFDLPPLNACTFQGGTEDISALDYIFYELGGASWNWDEGITHAIAWGQVAVRRFGFQWCKLATGTSPQQFAVRNAAVPYLVFPWMRLYELVTNPGHGESMHAHLLLSVIADVDQSSVVPLGWHPVLDAIVHRRTQVPADVVALLNRWSDQDLQWLHRLGMYPYEWDQETDWNVVRSTIQSWLHFDQT